MDKNAKFLVQAMGPSAPFIPQQAGLLGTLARPPYLFSLLVSKAQCTFEWMLTISSVSSVDRYLE